MIPQLHSRNSAITFDVGTAGIRAYQLAARGASLLCHDSLRLDLPYGHRRGAGATPPDYTRIPRLVRQGSFIGSEVALVLSPPDVRFCALRLPKKALEQSFERLREALAWEVAREMRADAHDLEVRHWLLPPGHQQGLNVMAVALPIERGLSWHELLAKSRLRLRRIDVSPCALVHLARRMWTPEPRELWGVLDLGSRRTTLTVVVGRVPAYIRSLSTSIDSWTDRLAEAFEVSPAEADQIKRAHGIQPAARGVGPTQSERSLLSARDVSGVVFGLLREPLDELIHEVNRCFAYVMQNFSDVSASRLLLAGGGANLRGLAQYLELQLGVSVSPLGNQLADDPSAVPWERPLTNASVTPEQAAAVGGALLTLSSDALTATADAAGGEPGEPGDVAGEIAVNLLPETCHNARRRTRRRNAWAATVLCAGLLVAAGWLVPRATDRSLSQLTRRFVGVQTRQAELNRQLTIATKIRNDLVDQGRALASLRQDHPAPAYLLALASGAPEGVVLTEIRAQAETDVREAARARAATPAPPVVNPPKTDANEKTGEPTQATAPPIMRISGYAVDHDQLTLLIDTLQQLPPWSQVELLSASREPFRAGEALAFRLECRQAEVSQ